jgi:hypothetical protein
MMPKLSKINKSEDIWDFRDFIGGEEITLILRIINNRICRKGVRK